MTKAKIFDLNEADWEYAIYLANAGQPGPLRRRLLDPQSSNLPAAARGWLADLVRDAGKNSKGNAARLDDEQVRGLRLKFRQYERARQALRAEKINLLKGDFYDAMSAHYHVAASTIRDALTGRKRFARIKA